jgi:hypothetical protein
MIASGFEDSGDGHYWYANIVGELGGDNSCACVEWMDAGHSDDIIGVW